MKLKPVVASLVVLGLMTPVFAHEKKEESKAAKSQQTIVDQNSAVNTTCSEKWFDRITLGGFGSAVGIIGNHDLPGSFTKTGNGSDLYINNANLLVDATLSKWSKVSLNLTYFGQPGEWGMTKDNVVDTYSSSSRIYADEVYVTLADFSKTPFFAKIGKSYVPFGEYNDTYVPWQIMSPTQMVSQTNGPTAIVGVASDFGLYASIFGLKGTTSPNGSSTNNIRNFGGKIGYKDNLSCFQAPDANININLSYIRNMWDSLFFTTNKGSVGSTWGGSSGNAPARDPVGALAAHFDLSYKALSVYADFVATLKNMADTYYTNRTPAFAYNGNSKFWGANINAAYAFETLDHDSSLGAGVQFSGNGQWFSTPVGDANGVAYTSTASTTGGAFNYIIPKWRVLAEYKIQLIKHTDLGLVYAHSKSYDFSNSGGRSSNVGYVRLGFKF